MTTIRATIIIPEDARIDHAGGTDIIYAGTYTIEMPADYDAALVTAADLVCDDAIRIVDEVAPTVRIHRLDESDATYLHYQYPRESRPQSCYVSLDLETGVLTADWNGAIGGSVPVRVWNGVVRRYPIPALRASVANELLEEIKELAQRVLGGSEVERRRGDWRGVLDDDAQDADSAIEALCEERFGWPDEQVNVWDAADYYAGLGGKGSQADHLGITAETTDEELAAIVDREERVPEGDADLLTDVAGYLEELRDYMREIAAGED